MQNTLITYSEGRKNLGKVANKQKSWARFKDMFREPSRTSESAKQYAKLPVSDKLPLKQADGFFCAAMCSDGSRKKENIGSRVILTFDLDENANELLKDYKDGLNYAAFYESFLHTSRSHTPQQAKFRLVVLLDRPITKEEHQSLSRIVAQMIDPTMRSMDPISHRMAQMMFKPTAPRDAEFIFEESKPGRALPVDEILDDFRKEVGDPFDVSLLPKNPEREDELRDATNKAEDPTAKDGPVGTFCRAWPISELIEEHLSDFYEPADDRTSSEPRYTPIGSTSSSGAVIYDDDKFIYSNHTTDPIAEMNVNAWDLYRLCKFAALDTKCGDNTPMNRRPSWKAMMDFATKDERYRSQSIDDRHVDIEDVLGDEDVIEPNSETVAMSNADDEPKKSKKEWHKNLEISNNGKFKSTLNNITQIVQNDKRTRRKLAYNEFTHEPCLTETIKTGVDYIPDFVCDEPQTGDPLSDKIDDTLRAMLGHPEHYGIQCSDRDLKSAVMLASLKRSFHPIRDYIEECLNSWDGMNRIDRVLHEYVGTPDTPYHSEVFRNTMVALVGRQYEPGLPFHNIMVLQAPNGGEGKSFFCKVLGMHKFYTDMGIDVSDPARVVEAMKGNIVVELGEIQSLNKSSHEAMLSFLSSDKEQVRVAYAKRPEVYKRQSIVIGTTNKDAYLRAVGGNRRYWPVLITRTKDNKISNFALEKIYPQLLGEAAHIYKQMRAEQPNGDFNLDLKSPEAIAEQQRLVTGVTRDTPQSELAGEVTTWLETPVLLSQLTWSRPKGDWDFDEKRVYRTVTSAAEVKKELLERGHQSNHLSSYVVAEALAQCSLVEKGEGKRRFGAKGSPDALPVSLPYVSKLHRWSEKEITQGYSLAERWDDLSDPII